MRIEAGRAETPRIYEGDSPVGKEGIDLFRRAGVVISDCKLFELATMNPADIALRISGHPRAEEMLFATFAGWTVDGERFDKAAYYATGNDPERLFEPWLVLTEAWMRMGFFGAGLQRAIVRADKEETPT